MSLLLAILIAALSIILPGFFLALALLKKTGMPMFEIAAIGFIFGLIFPPSMIWLESFLMDYIHFFTFSAALYSINVILLTIIGIALCIQQGALSDVLPSGAFSGLNLSRVTIKQNVDKDYRKRISDIRGTISNLNLDMKMIQEHERQEQGLINRHREEMEALKGMGAEERKKVEESHTEQERRLYEEHEAEERMLLRSGSSGIAASKQKQMQSEKMNYVWIILLVLMVVSFATRMLSIGVAPQYFEFDPYYDMISTQYILADGYQLLYEHAAWPTLIQGTIHRLQPIVPYLEAYWYNIAGGYSTTSTTINTTLLSLVSSWYPPITAALLVFIVFMFLYHEYGEYEGLIGAGLATMMPVLITTFIAGEQLVEPWGIFALFFFYAAYLLAARNPDEPRYAILTGIAFASNFLGAHYYTVTAGILSLYIILQGSVNVLRGKDSKSFFIMNAIVIGIILLFFIPYNLYGATLNERTPAILGIPITVGFPIFSLIGVFIADFIMKKLSVHRDLVSINSSETSKYLFLALFLAFLLGETYLAYAIIGYLVFIIPIIMLEIVAYPVIARQVLRTHSSSGKLTPLMIGIEVIMLLTILSELVIFFTPLGNSVFAYIQLSKKFTTASSPLFMTVQEYAPTGLNYDFGSGGFGLIGASIGGISLLVWIVMIAYSVLVILAIYNRDSKASILSYSAIWSVAVAGLIEVKYLPHFGVAYIIAIGAILGELGILYASAKESTKKIIFYAGILIVVIEAIPSGYQLLSAASNQSCTSIAQSNNELGADIYCNTIPTYWLQATAWMKVNVGPYAPRILSWWDYGDWINWFGNSNAVIRGDNSVAATDYAVAEHYVMTSQEGVNATDLQQFMDSVQAKYILFDDQLVPKWGALDFLACVDINQTSEGFAISQGAQVGQPYELGTSACEIKHDPAYLFIPLSQSISNYCQISNSTTQVYLHSFVIVGQAPVNQTYCVPVTAINNGLTTYLYSTNGTKTNAILTPALYDGETEVQSEPFALFTLLYAPNGPNGTITDAPSEFYNSTYYKGFFLGRLPGFTLVYPSNFTGLNYVNTTKDIMIYESDNYTGSLPNVTPKPSWVHNNYTLPG